MAKGYSWTDPDTGKSLTLSRVLQDESEGDRALFAVALGVAGSGIRDLTTAIEAWGARVGVPPRVAVPVLRDYVQAKRVVPMDPPIPVGSWHLVPGMYILTPDFIRQDPELGGEVPPAVLLVDYWYPEDGESLLVWPHDKDRGYDYNTADYPDWVDVVPDPGAAPSPDVGTALAKINAHRRALGIGPLDPAAAGWTDEDVILEARRIGNPVEQIKAALLLV